MPSIKVNYTIQEIITLVTEDMRHNKAIAIDKEFLSGINNLTLNHMLDARNYGDVLFSVHVPVVEPLFDKTKKKDQD